MKLNKKAMILGTISILFTWVGIHTVIVALLYKLNSFQVLLESSPNLIRILTLILSFSGLILFLEMLSNTNSDID